MTFDGGDQLIYQTINNSNPDSLPVKTTINDTYYLVYNKNLQMVGIALIC